MKTYIVIDGEIWPTDEIGEIYQAQEALAEAGLEDGEVWAGEGPDAYKNGEVLWAIAT